MTSYTHEIEALRPGGRAVQKFPLTVISPKTHKIMGAVKTLRANGFKIQAIRRIAPVVLALLMLAACSTVDPPTYQCSPEKKGGWEICVGHADGVTFPFAHRDIDDTLSPMGAVPHESNATKMLRTSIVGGAIVGAGALIGAGAASAGDVTVEMPQ